ncbi:DUF1289 domain-containing protein [Stenotrophobium rhamnosiphilum]|uniref:DUF1289 domain-containing protein n=1 Tax=Stenotrophobium rhamnosiphilum TaxID=2029166 RepID=A0A2T5MF79_9GAMM|nr:DUF1289 domain-containing protein [Stenotrophobium rhamnosiphilum]
MASPCINICELDTANICVGCGRSLNEIGEWSVVDGSRKQAICDAAAQRLKMMEAHGKHSAQ